MLGSTVLIVDDDRVWRNQAARFFSEYRQYTAHVAGTCGEAINMADTLRPDYVLLDYHLGVESGAGVAAHIRASEHLKKTLILVVSGDETKQEEAYTECQADHFILKGTAYDTMDHIMRGLRRRVCLDCGIVEKGDLRLETMTLQVFRDERPLLKLSQERFRLFTLLLEKSPETVTEDEMARQLYPGEPAAEKRACVKVLLHRLRQDLGPLADRIQNRRGEGWSYMIPAARKPRP